MQRERGAIYALKVLLFGILPLVAASLLVFHVYVRSRETSLIERNYRVLETAKRQLQGRFVGKVIEYRPFLEKSPYRECQIVNDYNLSLALQEKGGTLSLHLQGRQSCSMPMPKLLTPLRKLNFFDNVTLVKKLDTGYKIYYPHGFQHTVPIVDFQSLLESAQQTTKLRHSGSVETKNKESDATQSNSTSSYTDKVGEAFHRPMLVHHLGTEYRLFLIPISLQQNLPQDTTLDEDDWLLAGMVRQQRFTQETRQLSPMLLAVLGLFFITVVLVWPLLTLWCIGPLERLYGLNVRILVLSLMLAVSLLTFAILNCFSYLTLQESFDTEMKKIGDKIQTRFRDELNGMFHPLKQFEKSIQEVHKNQDGCTNWPQDVDECRDNKLKENLEKILLKSTFLNLVSLLWIDAEGKWVSRLTPEAQPTPNEWKLKPTEWIRKRRITADSPTSKDRRFFTDVQAGLLDAFRQQPKIESWDVSRQSAIGPPNVPRRRYTLDIVQSRISGDITVVMAAPLRLGKNGAKERPHVAVVASRFRPLMQAILPSGVGFAVINDTGDVLFHSDASKNLYENILQECDNAAPIRSAIFAQRARYIDSGYYGQGHRFYIQPLEETPWFLMVFRAKDSLRLANFTLTVSWLILFGLYMGSWGIVSFFLQLFGYRWEWLWPDPRHTHAYWEATGIVVCTATAGFATVWTAHALSTVVMFWVVPPLLLALLYLKLGRGQYGQHAQYAKWWVIGTSLVVILLAVDAHAWGSLVVFLVVLSVSVVRALHEHSQHPPRKLSNGAFRRAYSGMLFSLLVTVVIVPAVLVFLDARQQTLEGLMKHNQLHDKRALQKRDEHLRQEQVDNREPSWTGERRLGNKKDVYPEEPTNSMEKKDTAAFLWPFLLCGRSSDSGCQEELSSFSRYASARILQLLSAYSWPGERFGVMTYNSDETSRRELRDWDLFRFPRILWWAVAGLPAMFLIYKGLLLVASRIFLMDYEDDLPDAAPKGLALWLFVKPARQTFEKLLPTEQTFEKLLPTDAKPIDLLRIATPGRLQELPYSTSYLSIVDHLEDRLHEREWSTAVLSWLEALAFHYDGPVVVLSAIDPLYSLAERVSGAGANNALPRRAADMGPQPQGSGWAEKNSAAEEFERWARVLAQFSQQWRVLQVNRDDLKKIRAKQAWSRSQSPCVLPASSTFTTIIGEKTQQQREDTEARFRTIWSQCTRPEKLVLRQLAEEGFINPNNLEVIRSLGRRGLIYRDPALQLMSGPFKQFVLRVESRQTIAHWEGETEASWLSGLQTPLLLGLMVVAAFFCITQQEFFTTVLALAGAFAALLPRILQPFGMLRGQPGESRSGGITGS